MGSKKYDVDRELRDWLRGAGKVVVVGVGNPIRMDDFVGMKIVRDLMGRVDSKRVMLIEAETVPENHLQEIIDYKPTHILIIDAAIMGLKEGESRLVDPKGLANSPPVSTHLLPLTIFGEYLHTITNVDMKLLLVEPECTDFGEGMSERIGVVAGTITNILVATLS